MGPGGPAFARAGVVALFLLPGIAFASLRGAARGSTEIPRVSSVGAWHGPHAPEWDRALGRTGPDSIQEAREPAWLFQRQCVACHGTKGKGDGPAAPAMTPRPADLTDRARIGERSNEDLADVLTNGKGAMPSFGALLSSEEIREMVRYIRELSGTETDSTRGGHS